MNYCIEFDACLILTFAGSKTLVETQVNERPQEQVGADENCVLFFFGSGRLPLRAALPCGFTLFLFCFLCPPAHFGDLELTGTKKSLATKCIGVEKA